MAGEGDAVEPSSEEDARMRNLVGGEGWSGQARRLAGWLNPVVASPAAPLETFAALDEAPMGRRLATRALIGAGGTALAMLPERDGDRLWLASVRTTGRLLRAGAAGGAVHDLGEALQGRYPAQRAVRPLAVSAALTSGLLFWGARRLKASEAAVQRWPLPQTTTLPATLATSYAVTAVGTGLTRGFVWSRRAMESYFGPGPSKRLLARAVNAGVWAVGATALYNAGVAYIGRANENVEPAYSTPPASPLMSGSAASLLPFADLGQQGRRYVTDVVTPELIKEVMGEEALAHPVRTYVGFNSEPIYQTGRAELALAELERTGAFDRSHLLLVSPTGTGWVDHTLIEAAEFLTRGDIATCCIQYARYPSFLSVQKVALGRGQFRLLLWGVKQRLAERPPERRPRVLVFGESMGAWTSSDVLMYQGIDGFDHYGIERALWVGLPWLAKWSQSGMARGSSTLVPPGTVRVFDRHEQLAELSAEDRARLRAVILSHDNDPIAVLGPELLIRQPTWLADGQRGRGVPDAMNWRPLITFVQTAMDAANAMVSVPGEFGSFGHDYRADMVRFVRDAYGLPDATQRQLDDIEQSLRSLELERAERIKARDPNAAPTPPAHRSGDGASRAGVPLRTRRTRGARWSQPRRSQRLAPPAPDAPPPMAAPAG